MSKFKDLTGLKFGRLLVLGVHHKQSKPKYGIFYTCLCDCGNETIVLSRNLIRKNTLSCGCYRKEISSSHIPEYKKPCGYSEVTIIFGIYKTNAKRRNLEFVLNRNQFVSLIQQNCHYCGSLPSKISKHKNTNGEFLYNGIDRVDNTKGYILDNCVPCCETCNRAKLKLTQEEFLIWINRVYHYNQLYFDYLDIFGQFPFHEYEKMTVGELVKLERLEKTILSEGLSTYEH